MAPENMTPGDENEPLVRDIMRTDVVTIGPEATVHELVTLMGERDVSGMPVIDDSGHLVGIVTEGDLVVEDADLHMPFAVQFLGDVVSFGGKKKFEERLRKMVGNLVSEVMTSEVLTVHPDEAAVGVDHRHTTYVALSHERHEFVYGSLGCDRHHVGPHDVAHQGLFLVARRYLLCRHQSPSSSFPWAAHPQPPS